MGLAVVEALLEGRAYHLRGGNLARPGREQPNLRRQRSWVTGWRTVRRTLERGVPSKAGAAHPLLI